MAAVKASYTQRVAQLFLDRPGHWYDGKEIAAVGGVYAWRSRISNCRTQLGMVIENRERKVSFGNGDVFIASEYRLVPQREAREAHEFTAQATLF